MISWLGHLEKMEEDRMPKKIFTQELEGTRRRGRPRKRWKQELEWIKGQRISWLGHLERMEEDRMSKNSSLKNGRDENKGKTQEKMERGSRMDKRAKDKLVRPTRGNGGG